jgi:hypothetical protein
MSPYSPSAQALSLSYICPGILLYMCFNTISSHSHICPNYPFIYVSNHPFPTFVQVSLCTRDSIIPFPDLSKLSFSTCVWTSSLPWHLSKLSFSTWVYHHPFHTPVYIILIYMCINIHPFPTSVQNIILNICLNIHLCPTYVQIILWVFK